MERILMKPSVVFCLAAAAALTACGGGGSGSSPPPVIVDPPPPLPPPPPPPPPPSGNVTISGKATFDRVPHSAATNGLDYTSTRQDPIRRHVVEATDAAGTVIATTNTSVNGDYSVTVPAGADVRIRVRAQIVSTSGATYNIQILDNTSNDAPYILSGSLTNSGAANSTRNLNAPSGWGGSSYTGARSAGPFAITDTILKVVDAFVAEEPALALPPLRIFWSVNNRPATSAGASGLTTGDIGSSFFTQDSSGRPFIALLGAANNDTDEYDAHLIVHEFGHYFEETLSRSDSIGGSHSDILALDSRLAFSEGFGNALSGIILNDFEYRDSSGLRQSSGFDVDLEANAQSPTGWFNEGSVGSILVDVFDTAQDGPDNIAAGFGPIYRTFRSDAYRNTPYATNMASYLEALSSQSGINTTSLDALMTVQSIFSRRADMVGETNNGGVASVLPFYKNLTIGGPAVIACSTNDLGIRNRLGNYDFVRFSNSASRSVTVTAAFASGIGGATTDPQFEIFRLGRSISFRDVSRSASETQTLTLTEGEYLIAVASYANVSGQGTSEDVCYNVTVQ
jgi:hypothetical protein